MNGFKAVETNDLVWLEKNLTTENVNNFDHRDVGVFQVALSHGSVECVQLILNKGADVNLPFQCNENSIGFAVRIGRVEIIDMLISAGADIHTIDQYGYTLLDEPIPKAMTHILVDRGLCTYNSHSSENSYIVYANAIIASRLACRRAALSVASLHRHNKQLGAKDVFRLVAKHVWSMRMDTEKK